MVEDSVGLFIDHVTFGEGSGLNLHEFGKPGAVTREMQPIPIDPAVIATFSPGGVRIQMAQLLRNPPGLAVGLMPDRALGFEQTLVFKQVLAVQQWVQGFCILAQKGDELLNDRVERLIAARQRRAMRHGVQAQRGALFGVLFQPAMLGFEAKNVPLLHNDEKHDQGLVQVDKRMAAMSLRGRLLHESLKQGKQQLDIVGKGRYDHGGPSWKAWRLIKR